ncbi:motilin receptor-like isoform X1 [Mauremys reevesii]|uniref:motilin receptor-like isoform X1 n=1 Tax=Mauremys reevesii TaxID=260615 RepID=UPI00193F0737|nr:motilin receptor-like isoform X1 [Mauremys reevesii]
MQNWDDIRIQTSSVLCLTLLYGLICGKLWRTRHKLRGPQAASREKYHKQTVKMLAVVVLAFVLCWLPFHIGRILFAQTTTILYDITQYFNLIAMLLFYLGASINPILYNVMSQKYRKATSKILNYSQVWQSRNLTRSERTSLEGQRSLPGRTTALLMTPITSLPPLRHECSNTRA